MRWSNAFDPGLPVWSVNFLSSQNAAAFCHVKDGWVIQKLLVIHLCASYLKRVVSCCISVVSALTMSLALISCVEKPRQIYLYNTAQQQLSPFLNVYISVIYHLFTRVYSGTVVGVVTSQREGPGIASFVEFACLSILHLQKHVRQVNYSCLCPWARHQALVTILQLLTWAESLVLIGPVPLSRVCRRHGHPVNLAITYSVRHAHQVHQARVWCVCDWSASVFHRQYVHKSVKTLITRWLRQ